MNEIAMQINVPAIFNEVYLPFLHDVTPLQIFYGGASSGKSVFLAQRDVLGMVEEGRNILIVRQFASSIRQSCFNEILQAISQLHLAPFFHANQSDMVITLRTNDAQCFFRGLDDPEKLKSIRPKSGPITDIRVEEGTEISESSLHNLLFRLRGIVPKHHNLTLYRKRGHWDVSKRFTTSFNPIYRNHWWYTSIFGGRVPALGEIVTLDNGRTKILRTNYKHNKFLTSDDIQLIESYNDPENSAKQYWWQVYGLGEWGVMGDVIFTNWHSENLKERQFDNIDNGLDFGYSSDPSAFVRSSIVGVKQDLYVFDGFYQTHLTNPELASMLAARGVGDEIVWCDEAEPKSIKELRTDPDHKINARGARKGPDSVRHGVKWLQNREIVIDESMQWLMNEFSIYRWARDRHGQLLHPVKPAKGNDHGIDALRYANERNSRRAWALKMALPGGVPGQKSELDILAEKQERIASTFDKVFGK